MVKKIVLGTVAASFVGMLLLGHGAASYLHTSLGRVRDTVKSSVPIEFDIDHARRMVKNLVPDIRKNMHVIAQEEVEIERLDKQIAQAAANLDRDRSEIMRLKDDLSVSQSNYQYGGRSYTVSQVKFDLTKRFDRYKTQEATLASLREIQAAKHSSLEAARQKLEGMLTAKRQLEVDVEGLEAKYKMLEVAQTSSPHNIDDSQLGRVKDLIGDIRARLSVAERLVQSECNLGGEIPVSSQLNADNILDQVTEYFNLDGIEVKVAEVQAADTH